MFSCRQFLMNLVLILQLWFIFITDYTPEIFFITLKTTNMKKLLFALTPFILVISLSFIPNERSATCTGSTPCHACKNCKYCKHCAKDGKTCGVCKK